MMRKRLFVLMMAMIFLLQMVAPVNIVKAAGADITGKFLFITNISIKDPQGNELGNDISKSAEINLNYTWSIPNNQAISKGDYYTMQLPYQIKIVTAFDQPIINPADGNIVANMHVDQNGKVTITFTDYSSGHSDVHGGFTLNCHFDPDQIGNSNPVVISFSIPGQGVIISDPINFQQPDPSIVKNGSYNSATDEITWTLTVNQEGVQVNNASVEDIIGTGQTLVDNSVLINGSSAVLGTNYSYDTSSKKLIVNLGNIATKKVITFKTSVHDDLATKSQGTYNYSNAAMLKYEDKGTSKSITSNTVSIPITVKYITKDGSYNSSTKSIDWTIKVNESGRTINNAFITDNIPAGLTIDPSSIKLNGVSGSVYSGTGTGFSISGQSFNYYLGNINSIQTITFSTKVDINVYNSNNYKSYNNTAILSGDNVPSGTTASKGVGFTPSIIQKQSAGYDASKGIITWKITVNNNKTDVAAGAVVTDNIPIGQKYVTGSAKFDNSTINDSVYTDASAGDLTKTGTFSYTFASAFSDTHTLIFQTQITDPKVYRANYSGNFNNTVNLTASGINQNASASQPVSSEVINKTGINYNYATREITWKVVVNKNEMPITNAVITDDIPIGQEYVDNSAIIDNSAPAEGFSYTKVNGDASKTGTLVYTFPAGSTINDTYTITFKTKVTDLSIFNTNGTKSLNNTASISGDEIPSDGNIKSTGTQNINNSVISKTPSYTYGNAYIDWTVNINSNFNIVMSKAAITDILQDGLSLNTDTVELYKAVVNANGSLSAGTKITLNSDNVKYNPSTRKFDFTFPEDATRDAYILKFTTDVAKAGNYSNTIEFKGQSTDQSSTASQSNVWFASGSAWGTGISGTITVVKVDSNNNTQKLSGAVFELLDQYGNIKATSAPTGTDGTIVFKSLKYDVNYSLKEITPPAGYDLSSEVYNFQVHNTSTEKDIVYYYKDSKIKKDVQFLKKGEDGNGLQGAEFTLYKNDGITPILDAQGKNVTAISDQNGQVKFGSIEYGDYKIKETKAPEGYLLSSDILSVNFSGDYQNTVVTVTPDSVSNVKIRGGIKITKIDASTSAPLPGATIAVYTSDGKLVGSGVQGKTGQDGTVEFDNLPYGNYYFIEKEAPEGYLINNDKHPFIIKDNGVILKDSITDSRITGGIKITKKEALTLAPVPGATVAIYTSDGKPVGSGIQGKTGQDGTVEFNNLPYGSYYYLETNAPEGYLLNTNKHLFTIKDNGVILEDTFSDIKIRGTVLIKKNGEDGNYLGNTEFTLFDNKGKTIQKAVTDVNGIAKFTGIEYGSYFVKETNPPEGYTISDKILPIQVNGNEDGKAYDAGTITDNKIRGTIEIKKLDQDGKPLKGAEFTLFDSEGKTLQTAISSEEGTIAFKNLIYGNYKVRETKVPEGYLISKDDIIVSVKNDGDIYSYEVKNTRIRGTIEIKKTSTDGEILSGAEFTLYDNSGKSVSTAVSDNNGIARFEAVDYGNYSIRETKAPEGYSISEEVINIQIKSPKTQSFIVQDKKQVLSMPKTGGFMDNKVMTVIGILLLFEGVIFIIPWKRRKNN